MNETNDSVDLLGKQKARPNEPSVSDESDSLPKIDEPVRTEEEQNQAVAKLVHMAQKKLWLASEDGLAFRLDAHHDIFSERLKSLTEVRLLVMKLELFRKSCPRLMKLFQVYSHKVTLRQMEEGGGALEDSFLVADGRHAVVRYTPDEARGTLLVNQTRKVIAYVDRLEELWSRAEPPSGFTVLGL